MTGTIRLSPKDSSVNEWFLALFIYNTAEPLAAVEVDGQPLKLEECAARRPPWRSAAVGCAAAVAGNPLPRH